MFNSTSYSKPGVCMKIREEGKIGGAVSGGSVENEIKRQTQTVFRSVNQKL